MDILTKRGEFLFSIPEGWSPIFKNTDLLAGAQQAEADLSNVDLGNADLTGVCLARANLSNAFLKTATLRRADLSGACLCGADLEDADLEDANLSDALPKVFRRAGCGKSAPAPTQTFLTSILHPVNTLRNAPPQIGPAHCYREIGKERRLPSPTSRSNQNEPNHRT